MVSNPCFFFHFFICIFLMCARCSQVMYVEDAGMRLGRMRTALGGCRVIHLSRPLTSDTSPPMECTPGDRVANNRTDLRTSFLRQFKECLPRAYVKGRGVGELGEGIPVRNRNHVEVSRSTARFTPTNYSFNYIDT